MKKAKEIFSFNVFEEISKGKVVYALNKTDPVKGIRIVNDMRVEAAIHMKNCDDVMFWIVEEETDNG